MSTLALSSPQGLADPDAAPLARASGRSGAGLRIAVLDNGKAGADTLLERMAERLASRKRGVFVGRHRKGSAATPCEPELVDLLVEEADWVLTGTAD